MNWHVICDFDGTIALEDVTDGLLSRFAPPAWEEIEAEWKDGKIGSRDCMARQVALIRASREELDSYIDQVEIDPDFPAFARLCLSHGTSFEVVSDGLDYAIRRILSSHGLGHLDVIANHLVDQGEGYALEFPYSHATCRASSGTCKCRRVDPDVVGEKGPSLLIGDGASDFCGASAVDLVLAKDKLLTQCRKMDYPHLAITNFADAIRLFTPLLEDPSRAASLISQPT